MKRMKRHKVKVEKPEASSSFRPEQTEHDLAYYIHDRVELMHQVFSCLKYKELQAMAPACVRHISIDDLQELCTEELLGISSKRLCAILDGAEPPSDTESSSRSPTPALETISLDSISSDEEILSDISKTSKRNKKHKHRHKSSKDKSKARKERHKSKKTDEEDEYADRSKASRAGLTVLELLELQARARAIRAQLQNEQANRQLSESGQAESHHSSDNEVEIKEEPAEVVEISSDEEKKPNVQDLETELHKETASKKAERVTKRINDLVITIPQSKQTKKIKLNRTVLTTNTESTVNNRNSHSSGNGNASKSNMNKEEEIRVSKNNDINQAEARNSDKFKSNSVNTSNKIAEDVQKPQMARIKEKTLKKTKSKKKKKENLPTVEEDHDEITLQLSDTEKMDLLEDLGGKVDVISSSDTEDSESSSDTSENEENTSDSEVETGQSQKKSNSKHFEVDNFETDKVRQESQSDSSPKAKKPTEIIKIDDIDETFVSINRDKVETVKPRADGNSNENIEKVNSSESMDANIEVDHEKIKESIQEINQDSEKMSDKDKDDVSSKDIEDNSKSLINHAKTTDTEKTPNIPVDTDIEEQTADTIAIQLSDKNKDNSTLDIECANNNDEENLEMVQTDIVGSSDGDKMHDIVEKDSIKENVKDKTSNVVEPEKDKAKSENRSDGELSDNASSEIEVTDFKPDVVCISDEDVNKKKKKKKDKKKKKSKKKSDFREGSDQNFFKDKSGTDIDRNIDRSNIVEKTNRNKTLEGDIPVIDNDSVIKMDDLSKENCIIIEDEVLILSDDSSCYEVDRFLSKEPTAEEIEALSSRIDEIKREEIITEEEIREHERQMMEKKEVFNENKTDKFLVDGSENNIFNERSGKDAEEEVSWKERYLGSTKVKKVLTTANIFNALRKKNIELKKKLDLQKKQEEELAKSVMSEIEMLKEDEKGQNENDLELGSIEHYNTLQGSTKYVDPVKEKSEEEKEKLEEVGIEKLSKKKKKENVPSDMRRDAEQLLKMYKKLLKYSDVDRVRDPNKKKKKKKSKNLEKH